MTVFVIKRTILYRVLVNKPMPSSKAYRKNANLTHTFYLENRRKLHNPVVGSAS